MKEDNTQQFHQAFDKFLKEENLENRFNERKLITSWNEIMGDPIARRTSKVFIKDEVLFVKLTSAPLRQELTNAKTKVLELLERSLGKKVIRDVIFI